MKRVIFFFIVVLLLTSGFSIYSWKQCEDENKEMLEDVYTEFETNRWELENIGQTFEYLLQNNASDEVILLYTIAYRDHVFVVKNVFDILCAHSKEGKEKFLKLSNAMTNLHVFLNSAAVRPHERRRMMLSENLETLKQFDVLFEELNKYRSPYGIPDTLPERFLKVSNDLHIVEQGGS
ncbi:DsbA family protein [Thermococcus aggregans]|uniref:DsbA family protein n=1 Tax=Thermococcus aggregans TaxID=110163 RepID=A0A9E7MWF1_THEAG|nr:DsbA family protein [Thermococcus aggregans]USS40184.1 DsbA family protein [Thermococcus aggregans]